MLALFVAATATVAILLAARPAFTGSSLGPDPASWSGDDLAIAVMWWGAVLASAWLAITTLVCVAALARGRTRTAHRIARFAPPLARRVLQAALVSTWALVPAAAYAAPPAPITVHVDARGRLTTDAPRPRTDDTPIVRTPVTRPSTRSTTRAASTHNTTTTTSTTTPASRARSSPPPVAPKAVAPKAVAPKAVAPKGHLRAATPSRPAVAVPAHGHAHVVVAGDNLWQIARAEVIRAGGADRPADAQIAPYWQRVVEANRSTLRSGDPSLIFPGEVVTLP
jgi:hypothetical protein